MQCSICRKKDNDSINFGDFMQKSDITVHYYCLLSATNLPQRGGDHAGIFGFLLHDIREEIKKCAERICKYCKEPFASISCYTCKQYFHFICGDKFECLNEFCNEFHSYCHQHIPFKNEVKLQKMPPHCWICSENLGIFKPTQNIRANCCKNGYVHRTCLRKYALSAGYYLRCLWCGNKEFREYIKKRGIFVPDREACWDNNETQRFEDLHRGYSKCDAVICVCHRGRDFFSAKWKLKLCKWCGSSGTHVQCGKDNMSNGNYTCKICAELLEKSNPTESRKINRNDINDYSLFVSKTFQESEEPPDTFLVEAVVHRPADSIDNPERELIDVNLDCHTSSIASSSIVSENNKTTDSLISSKSNVSNSKPIVKRMYVVDKNEDILGTALVEVDKIKGTKKMVGPIQEDKLLKKIVRDVLHEDSSLFMDDEALNDEVFNRFKKHLTMFGEEDTSDSE